MRESQIVCQANDVSVPLVDRLRSHANDLNGDGCWRSLLNEAANEIATLAEVVRSMDRHLGGDPEGVCWPEGEEGAHLQAAYRRTRLSTDTRGHRMTTTFHFIARIDRPGGTWRSLYACDDCGAVVELADFELHDRWHSGRLSVRASLKTKGNQ
jgi:hypothetical protein